MYVSDSPDKVHINFKYLLEQQHSLQNTVCRNEKLRASIFDSSFFRV